MANTNQKSRSILNSLQRYNAGKTAQRDDARKRRQEELERYRQQYGPTLGDTVSEVADITKDRVKDAAQTAVVVGYVIYDDTVGNAKTLYNKSTDAVHDMSDKVVNKYVEAKDRFKGGIQEFKDNRDLKRTMREEKRNAFFNKVKNRVEDMKTALAEKYGNTKQSLIDKYTEAKDMLKTGAQLAVGAGALAFDKSVEAGKNAKVRADQAVMDGRRKVADKLTNLADKISPDDVKSEAVRQSEKTNEEYVQPPKSGTSIEDDKNVYVNPPSSNDIKLVTDDNVATTSAGESSTKDAVTQAPLYETATVRQAGRAVNKAVKGLKSNDKDMAKNGFAEWYMSLDDAGKQSVNDVLDNKREPEDVIGTSQAFRTSQYFDAKVGAVAFFKELRNPSAKDVLAVDDLKQTVQDMDAYVQAEQVFQKAEQTMTRVEDSYAFLTEAPTAQEVEHVVENPTVETPVAKPAEQEYNLEDHLRQTIEQRDQAIATGQGIAFIDDMENNVEMLRTELQEQYDAQGNGQTVHRERGIEINNQAELDDAQQRLDILRNQRDAAFETDPVQAGKLHLAMRYFQNGIDQYTHEPELSHEDFQDLGQGPEMRTDNKEVEELGTHAMMSNEDFENLINSGMELQ